MDILGKLSESDRRTFHERGGYSLGLEIARRHGVKNGLYVPRDIVMLKNEELDAQEILATLPNGFGVKTSGVSESFSEHSYRGANSSRGNFWDGEDTGLGVEIIERTKVKVRSTPLLRSMVFQEYIEGTKATLHVNESTIVYEGDGQHGKVLIRHGDSDETAELLQPTASTSQADGTDRLKSLFASAKKMRDEVLFDYDLEIISSDRSHYITQLRPIPNFDCLEHVTGGQRYGGHLRKIHETMFANGIWLDNRFFEIDRYTEDRPFVAIKKNPDIRKCTDINEALAAKIPTLVLDPFGGFRITHEPIDLPNDLSLRSCFGYISIASCSKSLEQGQMISARIDHNQGVLYE